jgi:transposase
LVQLTDPAYPDERLVACYHTALAEERGRKREDLLQATERELETIRQATMRAKRRLTGPDQMALRVGKGLKRFKMRKHFVLEITEGGFHYTRHLPSIEAETALDGVYVLRTSVPCEALETASIARAYKSLGTVERAFRSLKTVDLHVQPLGHRLAERVRAHVLLCMLAYYVEWHMRQARVPVLCDDDDKATAEGPTRFGCRARTALVPGSGEGADAPHRRRPAGP